MRTHWPKNLLAHAFAISHLAFCVLFFAAYFTSPDSERGMALIVFAFVDPWVLPVFRGFAGGINSEIGIATLLTVFGTAFWWVVGWSLRRLFSATKTLLGPKS